jgi:hypothetical protein
MSSPPEPSRPYYGSGYAGTGFRGIGGHLLREFPPIADPAPAPAPPPPVDPTESGFGAHGAYLLAPMRVGPDGSRAAACPVCATAVGVPRTAGAWAQFRCRECGTEFYATDGTAPPPALPPPAPPPPVTVPRTSPPLVTPKRAPKPSVWGRPLFPPPDTPPPDAPPPVVRVADVRASGGARWVYCPDCHGVNTGIPRGATGEFRLTCLGCGVTLLIDLGKKPVPAVPPPSPPPPPPPPTTAPVVRTTDVRGPLPGGTRWVPCPLCRVFNVALPRGTTGEVTLTCPGCRGVFVADPRAAKPARPSVWAKLRKWWTGG